MIAWKRLLRVIPVKMNLKSSSLLLICFTSIFFAKAQISKQEIIKEVNFLNEKFNTDKKSFNYPMGHIVSPEETILLQDFTENHDKSIENSTLVICHYFYPDNFSKITIYFKNNIPIEILKEKKIVLDAVDNNKNVVIKSLKKFYIFDWVKWEFEKEIIQDGGRLLENSIDKQEIINIINESKKK